MENIFAWEIKEGDRITFNEIYPQSIEVKSIETYVNGYPSNLRINNKFNLMEYHSAKKLKN